MKVIFDRKTKAQLSLDEAECVRQINHFQEYWASEKKTPLLAAIDYLHQMADLLQIPKAQLKDMHQHVSFLEPKQQGIEYRLSEEKQLFDSTTLGFYQTYLNVPVWQAGLTVTIKHNPYRIISAVNTSQEKLDARLPSRGKIEHYKKLFTQAAISNQVRRLRPQEEKKEAETAGFVRNLVDQTKLKRRDRENNARLIRGRFYVYKFDENNRLPRRGNQAVAENALPKEPVLPLHPIPKTIRHGEYYVVAEITFSLTTQEFGRLNWLALVEVETGSVLYLRALVGLVNGMVFRYDPITASGNAGNTADKSNADLNPWRSSEPLPNLEAPTAGVQLLRGTYANVTNVEDPDVVPPTKSVPPGGVPSDFDFDVRSNDFAAVNAYYHVNEFFSLMESLGFPVSNYFSNTWNTTLFPIPVDHRDHWDNPNGLEINAYCSGNGLGGIDHVGYMLNDLTDTDHPVGRACDSRVHLHELGGHGVLYEHVNSANFGFCHSAGDSLSAILHDPESQAPDRFRYAPWNPINTRRFDRAVPDWAWGGPMDDKQYGTEQILATTLFRVYRSIGGDSTDLARRQFASRMMLHLILDSIRTLTQATNPADALTFANKLMESDLINWTTEGICGGAYKKVVRWSFVEQGLSALAPPVDVYIEDGRGGAYMPYQAVHWQNTSIWNRRNADGGTDHQEPAPGVTNYAYVKIKNRGTQTANNVIVRGYHCKPSAGVVWPNDFQTFSTTEISVGTLAGNNSEDKKVGPFEWTPVINGYGHDCMLMIVSADDDPSNVDNFTLGEFIPDWRLVPNDNNIGQRNVALAPGGGGGEGLMQGLHGHSFWVCNPNLKTSTIELRAQLPEMLTSKGWHLSFKSAPENRFRLRSGKQQEIVMELRSGKNFSKQEVEKSLDRNILITVHADDMLIGGLTYQLDPEIREPYNKLAPTPEPLVKHECQEKAQELLKCLDISGRRVKDVHIKKVTVDIELRDQNCGC